MKKAFLILSLAIATAVGVPASAQSAIAPDNPGPPKIGVLLDGSLTMEGFFKTGEFFGLHDKIAAANQGGDIAGRDTVFIFDREGADISQPYRSAGWDLPALGKLTFIDRAYTRFAADHQDTDIVWLATDNVQDKEGQGPENGDIAAFYDKLRDDRVKRVYVFPTALHYDGRLWTRNEGPFTTYNNDRGLVVYAILLNDRRKDFFEQSVKKFSAAIGLERGGILVKPLGEYGSVTAEIIPDPDASPQERLRVENGRLVPPGAYEAGKPIKGNFLVRFRSNLDNVVITDPEVDVELIKDFRLSDFSSGEPEIKATPQIITGPMDPGKTSEAVAIFISFPSGVELIRPWKSPGNWRDWGPLARATLQRDKGMFAGSIKVRLKVRQSQFSVPRDVLLNYSTNDAGMFSDPLAPSDLHRKVFELDRVFASLASTGEDSGRVSILTNEHDIGFNVRYPVWPILVWLAMLAVLAALASGVWYALAGSPVFSLTRNGKHFYFEKRPASTGGEIGAEAQAGAYRAGPRISYEEPSVRLPFFRAVPIFLVNVPGAYLRRFPGAGVRATAANGYLINEKQAIRLDETGSSFTIDHKSDLTEGKEKAAPGKHVERTPDSYYRK